MLVDFAEQQPAGIPRPADQRDRPRPGRDPIQLGTTFDPAVRPILVGQPLGATASRPSSSARPASEARRLFANRPTRLDYTDPINIINEKIHIIAC